jgi:hypothetical protein
MDYVTAYRAVFLEKLMVLHLDKNFPTVYGIRWFITVFIVVRLPRYFINN